MENLILSLRKINAYDCFCRITKIFQIPGAKLQHHKLKVTTNEENFAAVNDAHKHFCLVSD